jgi:hypothetical protein
MPICIIGKTHARAPPVTPGRRRRRRIRTITDGIVSIHHHRINRSLRGAFIFITRAHSFFIFIYTPHNTLISSTFPRALSLWGGLAVWGTTEKKKTPIHKFFLYFFCGFSLFREEQKTSASAVREKERERERERESKVNSEREQKERTHPQFTPRERNCARPLLLLFFF